jgi:hypothetical protein
VFAGLFGLVAFLGFYDALRHAGPQTDRPAESYRPPTTRGLRLPLAAALNQSGKPASHSRDSSCSWATRAAVSTRSENGSSRATYPAR